MGTYVQAAGLEEAGHDGILVSPQRIVDEVVPALGPKHPCGHVSAPDCKAPGGQGVTAQPGFAGVHLPQCPRGTGVMPEVGSGLRPPWMEAGSTRAFSPRARSLTAPVSLPLIAKVSRGDGPGEPKDRPLSPAEGCLGDPVPPISLTPIGTNCARGRRRARSAPTPCRRARPLGCDSPQPTSVSHRHSVSLGLCFCTEAQRTWE